MPLKDTSSMKPAQVCVSLDKIGTSLFAFLWYFLSLIHTLNELPCNILGIMSVKWPRAEFVSVTFASTKRPCAQKSNIYLMICIVLTILYCIVASTLLSTVEVFAIYASRVFTFLQNNMYFNSEEQSGSIQSLWHI